jgi:hypothetical protein
MDQDYGTLTCIGQNDVGEQVAPCVFQVILAGEGFEKLNLFQGPRMSSSLLKIVKI